MFDWWPSWGDRAIIHLVTAERGLLAGHSAAVQIAWVLLAVFAPLTRYLYARRA